MKSIKSLITLVVFLIFVTLSFPAHALGGCESSSQQPDYKMYIRIKEPNFLGEFSSFAYANFLDITINCPQLLYKPIVINKGIEFTSDNYVSNVKPKFLDGWKENDYKFETFINFDGTYEFEFVTNFVMVNNDWWSDRHQIGYSINDYYYNIKLKKDSVNDISLTYNGAYSYSHFTVEFKLYEKEPTPVFIEFPMCALPKIPGLQPLNQPVGKLIHPKSVPNNIPSSINLVVMAEGYNEDQIRYFRSYAENAFAGVANFNLNSNASDDNNFFQRNWEANSAEKWKANINVFMYETISPQAGIGDNIRSYFNVHPQYPNRTDTVQMRTVVNATASEMEATQLPVNVDAYILLVNDNSISSYTQIVDRELGQRSGQPVNYMIIRAPVGYDVNNGNFHNYVETNKIGQLLGTAISMLTPEYGVQLTQYNSSLRNISQVKEPSESKWRKLWAVEDFQAANENDHRLRNSQNSLLGSIQLYSPSGNCVMRGSGGSSAPTQFCPVCEYHLEGSFRTRMGVIPAQNPLYDGSNINTYEWRGFSVEDFRDGNYFIVPGDPVEFVVVGNNGSMARSSDGIHWTQIITDTNNWSDVAYGNGRWVAVANDGNMAYSRDSINWTQITLDTQWFGIAYGNGRWVATGVSGRMAHSSDGINWTQITVGSQAWRGAIYGNGRWVAIATDGRMAYSSDGIDWTQIVVGVEDWWYGITYGNGRFVAVANDGSMVHSSDGISWTKIFVGTQFWWGVTYGNGRFVAVGRNGNMAHSTNGINWTQITVGTPFWYGVAYSNGKFVAVGSNGNMAHSTNGINWTLMSLGTASWNGVGSADN